MNSTSKKELGKIYKSKRDIYLKDLTAKNAKKPQKAQSLHR
jgi:hypothetical protein